MHTNHYPYLNPVPPGQVHLQLSASSLLVAQCMVSAVTHGYYPSPPAHHPLNLPARPLSKPLQPLPNIHSPIYRPSIGKEKLGRFWRENVLWLGVGHIHFPSFLNPNLLIGFF